jgi:hypothetical protein
MWLRSLLKSLKSRPSVATFRHSPSRPRTPRLGVEALDDRCLPSTFTVTNLLDSGAGSLRAAVASANANPGVDDIDFTVTGTIPLTSGQLDVTDSVTINGPGESALTVSGENLSRVFATSGAPTVAITNLTVANGRIVGSPYVGIAGGGIFLADGTVTLDHVTVSGNSAVGGPGVIDYYSGNYSVGHGAGGGIFVAAGTVTLNQCTVTGNAALGGTGADGYGVRGGGGGTGSGGGLWVQGGTVQVNQSIISGNLAVGGNGGDGQSIYEGTTYGGSGGFADGGGIRVWGGSVQIHQSSIFENVAVGGSGGWGTWYDEYGVWGGYWSGDPGWSGGGGLTIDTAAPPLVDLDTYTESNTINNYADYEPNIWGPYSLNGTWVPPLTISDVSRLEGNSGTTAFVFTVSIPAAISQTVSVNYATADGSATAADNDYQPQSGTLTFAPGETSKTVTVLVNGDRLAEPVETFFVNLTEPANAVITDPQGMGTIVNEEPSVSISDVTRWEGNTGTTLFAFIVSLSPAYSGAPVDGQVTVNFATADGSATAGSDYQATSGTLTIPAGQTTGTITVLVNGDRLPEPKETFFVTLSNLNYGFAGSGATGTILDDEPRISIHNVAKAEGRKNHTTLFTFTVTLSAAYDEPVTVSYRTTDGTATTSDGDYVAQTGTLTFLPGETSKTITIVVNGDSKKEADEYFYLDLFGNSGNSLFTKNRGLGTILNDD